MAYTVIHIDKNTSCAEYICETVADLATIPHKENLFGSLAYVLADKKIYIMNNSGNWEEQ